MEGKSSERKAFLDWVNGPGCGPSISMLILSIDPRIIPVSVLKRLALKTGRESENRVGTTRRLVSLFRPPPRQ